MKIAGSVAFVSGTNRGIGRAYVEALLARGAKKIYATARKSASVIDLAKANPGRIELLALEVTDEKSVAAAADRARDVTLLINNAGVNHNIGLLAAPSLAAAREEIKRTRLTAVALQPTSAPNRNGRGSSPCPTPRRSPARTSPSRPR